MSIGEIVSSGDTGPRDRLLVLLAVAAILIWGFTGWEYADIETVRNGASVSGFDLSETTDPVGELGRGEELFQANGCYACHSLDGEAIIGPTLLGIFGATVELDDGSSVLIDDAYLVESILQPDAKRVAGYSETAMPSYEGIVSTGEAAALAEYIKSVR